MQPLNKDFHTKALRHEGYSREKYFKILTLEANIAWKITEPGKKAPEYQDQNAGKCNHQPDDYQQTREIRHGLRISNGAFRK